MQAEVPSVIQTEISKEKLKSGNTCKCDLSDLLLICKILDTLPSEYFSFRSSWVLISSKERTVENLTNQLVTYEKSLQTKNEVENSQEVLYAGKEITKSSKQRLFGNYCKQPNYKVKQCDKWKADGRPPKPEKKLAKEKEMSLLI